MKTYWDAAALVEACFDAELRSRLRLERGVTRNHALAETFSVLTSGRVRMRLSPSAAASIIDDLVTDLDFIELTTDEIRTCFKAAQAKGVRGGRVHDFLHIAAAEKAGVGELITLDQNDFDGLSQTVKISKI
jgi:predicted nucleic acid-binding protein